MNIFRDAATCAGFGLLFAAASSEWSYYVPDWLRPLSTLFVLGAVWYGCRAIVAIVRFGGES
jgi:hypothetical protein